MTDTACIKGVYLKYSESKGFVYQYVCEACAKTFTSNAPEVNPPCICHNCFVGADAIRQFRAYNNARQKGRRSKTKQVPEK